MKKAGSEAYDGMKSILIDVVSEAVKKSLFVRKENAQQNAPVAL